MAMLLLVRSHRHRCCSVHLIKAPFMLLLRGRRLNHRELAADLAAITQQRIETHAAVRRAAKKAAAARRGEGNAAFPFLALLLVQLADVGAAAAAAGTAAANPRGRRWGAAGLSVRIRAVRMLHRMAIQKREIENYPQAQ